MLIAQNCDGLRPAAAPLLAAALIACSSQAALQPSPITTPLLQSAAADLRTHIDLLLAEHVMIVAKETAAAFNHADSYASYTALLGANSRDLSAIIGRAFGTTTAAQFQQVWDMQNGYLVDYAIGAVTHDEGKAGGAMTGLRDKFQVQFSQLFRGIALADQLSDDKTFIDDLSAQRYASFYADLHTAYGHTQVIGDALADEFVNRFPDKFPGRIDGHDVDNRVAMNLLLQEHSYLTTMATDATIAKRDGEKAAAVSALSTSARHLGGAWAEWDAALVAYATGAPFDAAQFAGRLASGVPKTAVKHLIDATIKAIDDQKADKSRALADDDRAAATATQPIADSL